MDKTQVSPVGVSYRGDIIVKSDTRINTWGDLFSFVVDCCFSVNSSKILNIITGDRLLPSGKKLALMPYKDEYKYITYYAGDYGTFCRYSLSFENIFSQIKDLIDLCALSNPGLIVKCYCSQLGKEVEMPFDSWYSILILHENVDYDQSPSVSTFSSSKSTMVNIFTPDSVLSSLIFNCIVNFKERVLLSKDKHSFTGDKDGVTFILDVPCDLVTTFVSMIMSKIYVAIEDIDEVVFQILARKNKEREAFALVKDEKIMIMFRIIEYQ